jgi:hypothetical protein
MSAKRLRQYVAAITDPDGVTHSYVFTATSRRRATADAREWVSRWNATLVGIEPANAGSRRRLLAVAGVAFAVSATTIAATMIVGLTLEGAL